MGISILLKDQRTLLEHMDIFATSRERREDGLAQLSYCNGLLTAVVSGPEVISPREWLALILDPSSLRSGIEEARFVTEAMMREYVQILDALSGKKGPYEPFFWQDGEGRLVTRDWAEGFLAGTQLRPDEWASVFKRDARSLRVVVNVLLQDKDADVRLAETGFDPEAIFEAARTEIPLRIRALYDRLAPRKLAHAQTSLHPAPRAGRNQACPCGSGKKYKKCCLN